MPTVKSSEVQLLAEITVNELNPARITATLLDESGSAVLLSSLSTLTLTIYDLVTDGIINSRNDQDIKNVNGGTYHATSGLLTLVFSSLDNPIVTAGVAGTMEKHIALIEATWSGGGAWCGQVRLNVRQVHRRP